MKITVDMPPVQACSVSDCAYNNADRCHAKAITIGDGVHPGCDTFLNGDSRQIGRDIAAGVGACKVSACSYNQDLECSAEQIRVSMDDSGACCTTFSQR